MLGIDPKAVKPSNYAHHTLEVESDDDKTVRIVSYVPRPEKLEVGLKQQSLKEHVGAVRRAADKIIETFQLAADDGIRRALELAADFHDHGKNRERWQRIAGGQASPTGQDWLDATLGKSGTEMKRDPRGYRHEFGSLCEFTDSFDAGKLLGGNGKPISRVVFDLAMHLIATHHGRGRPHFPNGGFDPDHESRSDKIHSESVRRFARLQRKYGWWHLAWLENLLRCADALASAGQRGGRGPLLCGGRRDMNDPEQSIRIPVDLTNPGQFFACCGLLELADRLWPGTEGWFSSHNCFVLEPRCSGSIDTLISSVIDCELEPLLPAEVRKELRELENKKRERKAEGRTLQKELEKRRKSLSSKRIAAGFRLGRPFQLRVDWWLADDCDGAHLATWAGRQEISEIAIDIKHSLEKVPVDELLDYESLIERRAGGLPPRTSQFRFRTRGYRARHRLLCRQSWTADRLLRLDRVLGTYRDPAIRPETR